MNQEEIIDRLKSAINWVLTDQAYKAPEQKGDPDIQDRWWDRLRSVLQETA